jgi:hypothetical protein
MGYGALLPFLDGRRDALTNACSNSEPVKMALNTVEAPVTILSVAGVSCGAVLLHGHDVPSESSNTTVHRAARLSDILP